MKGYRGDEVVRPFEKDRHQRDMVLKEMKRREYGDANIVLSPFSASGKRKSRVAVNSLIPRLAAPEPSTMRRKLTPSHTLSVEQMQIDSGVSTVVSDSKKRSRADMEISSKSRSDLSYSPEIVKYRDIPDYPMFDRSLPEIGQNLNRRLLSGQKLFKDTQNDTRKLYLIPILAQPCPELQDLFPSGLSRLNRACAEHRAVGLYGSRGHLYAAEDLIDEAAPGSFVFLTKDPTIAGGVGAMLLGTWLIQAMMVAHERSLSSIIVFDVFRMDLTQEWNNPQKYMDFCALQSFVKGYAPEKQTIKFHTHDKNDWSVIFKALEAVNRHENRS